MQSSEMLPVLREYFGDNRAEWPPERLKELFVEPSYFSKLDPKQAIPAWLIAALGFARPPGAPQRWA